MPQDYHQYIISDPAICGGEPIIKGTRVPVRTILASLAEGMSVAEILKDFPTLDEEAVRAVIAFAAHEQEKVFGKEDGRGRLVALFVGVMAVVVVLWGAMGFIASTRDDPGQFGDMFGAVNALFSGLAFAGIIITIWLQSKELKLQRMELAQTRDELKGQKEALQRQVFETSFFNLMNRHNELINSIVFHTRRAIDKKRSEPIQIKGRDALAEMAPRFEQWTAGQNESGLLHYFAIFLEGEARSVLPPFHRSLGEVLRFLERLEGPQQRADYARIVRAQLLEHDVVLLYLHGLCGKGWPPFKPLIEDYGLLEAMPKDIKMQLPSPGHYEPTAFGSNEHWIERCKTDRQIMAAQKVISAAGRE